MNYPKQVSILSLLMLFSVGAFAQKSYTFSLAEAVQHALQNNASLQASTLAQESNRYQKQEINAALLPQISGSASLTHFMDQQQSFLPASFFNPQAEEGEVIATQFGLPNSSSAGISAQWMIYNQAVLSARKMLDVQSDLTDIQIQKDQDEVAYTVSQLYYGISFAQQQADLLQHNIDNLGTLLATLESNYQNGLIKAIEVDKVRVNKANLESQHTNLLNTISTQHNLLKLFLGLPTTANLSLSEQFTTETLSPIIESELLVERTPDYAMLNKQKELNLLEKGQIRAQQLPTLGVAYNFNYNWSSENLGEIYSSDLQYPMQYVGLSLNVPIFSGGANQAKMRQNDVQRRQLQYQAEFLEDKLFTDITNARIQYNQNVAVIGLRAENVRVADKVYAQTTLEYEEGLLPLSEVLNSDNALREAQTQYLSAISNALMALIEYQKISGSLTYNN